MTKHKYIRVKIETYEALRQQGTMKDTFDTVIQKLLNK